MRAVRVFFLVLILPLSSFAQLFSGGLKAGLTMSQIAGDGFSGYNKAGLFVGCWGAINLQPDLSLQMDIAYTQKGSAQQASDARPDIPQYLLRLNYVEMPLVVTYQMAPFAVEAGLSFDFLVGQKETINFVPNDQGDIWRKVNLASVLGLKYLLSEKWMISLRSINSISSIRKNSVPKNVRRYSQKYGAYNDVLALGLIYRM